LPTSLFERLRRDVCLLLVASFSTIFLGVSLWVTRHGAPLPPDALEYAEVARSLVRGEGYTIDLVELHAGVLSTIRHLHELHGLLEPVLLAPLFWLWGASAALVRVPGVCFVAALSVATYLVGKHHFGNVAGAVAGLLVLTRRDLALDGTLGADDVGWAFFSTLALYFFGRAVASRGDGWFVCAGTAAAFATLEKVSGIALPACFIVVLVRGAERPVNARSVLALVLPSLGALGLYAFRNRMLHGGLGFRYSALDWLSKDAAAAYFAYYEQAPKVTEVLANFGASRVFALVGQQVSLLGSVVIEQPLVFVGGPVALVFLVRRSPPFAWFGLAYSVAIAALVCVAYHVEARYLSALLPVYFVALAGAGCALLGRAREKLHGVGPRRPLRAVVGVALVVFLWGFWGVLGLERQLGRAVLAKGACDPAIAFIRSSVGPHDAVLTSSPWFVTWATERPSVNVPTNGTDALVTVAEHYDARWAIDGLPSYGAANVGEALRALDAAGVGMRPERVFEGAECSVYRLIRQ